eukprot:scaffold367_cov254-Pinguiococcus_pyrenoidosus.AAC.7
MPARSSQRCGTTLARTPLRAAPYARTSPHEPSEAFNAHESIITFGPLFPASAEEATEKDPSAAQASVAS